MTCFPSIGSFREAIGAEDVAAVSHEEGVRGGRGHGPVVAYVRLLGADVAVEPLHGARVVVRDWDRYRRFPEFDWTDDVKCDREFSNGAFEIVLPRVAPSFSLVSPQPQFNHIT